MHRNSARRSSLTNASSPVSSQPSVAGFSPSPIPGSQTLAATLTSIRETGGNTINLISNWRKKTLTSQELAGVLRASLTKHDALLNTTEEPNAATLNRLFDLNTILLDVQRAVRAEVRPRKKHVAKAELRKFLLMALPDVFPLCQTRVMYAFQTLEDTLPVSRSISPSDNSQQEGSTSAVRGATSSPFRPGLSDRAKTAIDVTETILQVAVGVGEVAPLAGPILKAVGSIGLGIIKILNGVVNNREEAQSLAKYVQDVVVTVDRFVETGALTGGETLVNLRALEATFKSVRGDLESFTAQGGFRQGVSHVRNKEILAGCDTQIRRSFTQLQASVQMGLYDPDDPSTFPLTFVPEERKHTYASSSGIEPDSHNQTMFPAAPLDVVNFQDYQGISSSTALPRDFRDGAGSARPTNPRPIIVPVPEPIPQVAELGLAGLPDVVRTRMNPDRKLYPMVRSQVLDLKVPSKLSNINLPADPRQAYGLTTYPQTIEYLSRQRTPSESSENEFKFSS